MNFINPKHLYRSTKNSLSGLSIAWKNEQAFRHEILLLPVIGIALAILRPGLYWSVAILGAWLIVLSIELLNSAIEQLCNKVCPEYDLLIKYSKDMASAAIFMALCLNGLLWLAMLWDYFTF